MTFHVCPKQKQTVNYKTLWKKIFHKINFGVVTKVHHNNSSTETHHDNWILLRNFISRKEQGMGRTWITAPVKYCNCIGNYSGQNILSPSVDYKAFYRVQQCDYPHLNQVWWNALAEIKEGPGTCIFKSSIVFYAQYFSSGFSIEKISNNGFHRKFQFLSPLF